ncbi:DUF6611 family protein [Microlunatus soli]|uniref:Uncharacterized protein n=1 Tax=Microlunatus soli TaxID=630515 RepID=A0A1H1YY84_9ACTN|nr:DUF6611 family protein [Microlunatus soli]SDT26515.1 hypothetical protein SAMN04489812_4865 [Microlunatus soli]
MRPLDWTTGAHFCWGIVRRGRPSTTLLVAFLYPPGTSAWQRFCTSTAALPIFGWLATAVGLILYSIAHPTVAVITAFGLFGGGAMMVRATAAPVRRRTLELVCDERSVLARSSAPPSDRSGSGDRAGSAGPSATGALIGDLIAADTAWRSGRMSRIRFDRQWATVYQAARLAALLQSIGASKEDLR